MNFNLKQHWGWSIQELESLLPFEREVYIILLKQYIEAENKKAERKKLDG